MGYIYRTEIINSPAALGAEYRAFACLAPPEYLRRSIALHGPVAPDTRFAGLVASTSSSQKGPPLTNRATRVNPRDAAPPVRRQVADGQSDAKEVYMKVALGYGITKVEALNVKETEAHTFQVCVADKPAFTFRSQEDAFLWIGFLNEPVEEVGQDDGLPD